jgi:hypothetical protein
MFSFFRFNKNSGRVELDANRELRSGADKSLAFLISPFRICSRKKIIFLGWVKEVRTMKS